MEEQRGRRSTRLTEDIAEFMEKHTAMLQEQMWLACMHEIKVVYMLRVLS